MIRSLAFLVLILAAPALAQEGASGEEGQGVLSLAITARQHWTSQVSVSQDGTLAATTGWDGVARVWSTDPAIPLWASDPTWGAVLAVHLSANARDLVLLSDDGIIRVVDTHTKTLRRAIDAEADLIAVRLDGARAVTSGETVDIWDLRSDSLLRMLDAPPDVDELADAVAMDAEGEHVAVRYGLSRVYVYDVTSGRVLWHVGESDYRDYTSPVDTRREVEFSGGGVLRIGSTALDAATGKRLWRYPEAIHLRNMSTSRGAPVLVAWESDLVSDDYVSHFVARNAQTGDTLRTFSPTDDVIGVGAMFIQSSSVSPDGRVAVTSSFSGAIGSWEVSTGTPRGWPLLPGRSDTDAPFHPWDATPRLSVQADIPVDSLWRDSARLSPDGRTLALGFLDGTVRLRTLDSGHTHVLIDTDGAMDALTDEFSESDFTLPSQIAFDSTGAFLVTSGLDGILRYWDIATRQEVAREVQFEDGSWLVTTPEGRFDAPDLERIEGAAWVAPDDPLTPISIEAFMREYYEPRLLSRILAGEAFPNIGSILGKNRVQPEIEIATVQLASEASGGPASGANAASGAVARVTVHARGTARTYGGKDRTSGVRDVRLFRDGQLVGWADSTVVDSTGAWTRTFSVPLASGADSVAFSAYAFNRDLVKSRTAYVDLAVPPEARPRRQRRAFIVSLGVDRFDDLRWDLAFAAADARAYHAALDSTLRASGEYDAVVAVELVSDHDPARSTDATAAALRGALLRLAGDPLDADAEAALAKVPGAERLSEVTPDDVVIVTASTHGYASPEGIFYLLPSDVPTVTSGPALKDAAFLDRAVSSDELSLWLRGVDAGTLAVVVDACNAAGAVEGNDFKPGPMGARGLGQLAFDKGAAVLTATQADAPALEASATERGLLTFALVENGLLSGQADGAGDGAVDGRITLEEWLAYGAARVPGLYVEVASDSVSTYGQGVRVRSLPPELAGPELAEGEEASGAQTPALFDFRKGARPTTLATGRPWLVPQLGQGRSLESLNFSPDGRLLVGLRDGAVVVWDAMSGAELREIRTQGGAFEAFAFAPSGPHLWAAGADGVLRYLDVETGREEERKRWAPRAYPMFPPGAPYEGLRAVAAHPDGDLVAVAGNDRVVRLWDQQVLVDTLHAMGGGPTPGGGPTRIGPQARTVTFSPDGRFVFAGYGRQPDSASEGYGVGLLMDLQTGDRAEILTDTAAVVDAVFSPDSKSIQIVGGTGRVETWEVAPLRKVAAWGAHEPPAGPVFGRSGLSTVSTRRSGGDARIVEVTDMPSGSPVAVRLPPGSEVAAITPSGSRILVHDPARRFPESPYVVYDRAAGEAIYSFERGRVTIGATFSRDGDRVLTQDTERTLKLWDLAQGSEADALLGVDALVSFAAAFTPDGRHLALNGGGVNDVVVWDLLSGEPGYVLSDGDPFTYPMTLSFSDDGSVLMGWDDLELQLWDWQTETLREPFWFGSDEDPYLLGAATLSGDNRWLVTANVLDEGLKVWDVEGQTLVRELGGGEETVLTPDPGPLAVSPDGAKVLSVRSDTARVWTWQSGAPPRVLPHAGDMAQFVAEGRQIATLGADATLRWWDAESGDLVRQLPPGSVGEEIVAAHVTPGGDRVVTVEASQARVWDAATGAELVRFLSFQDGSWLVATPDGRFDAPNLEAISGAVWVAPDDPLTPLPIEAFMREYYEPRLLPRVLAGETFPDIGSLLERNRVQPETEIKEVTFAPEASGGTNPTSGATALVAVRARGMERTYGGEARTSGVRDVRLFRDGQLVGWADGIRVPETGAWDSTFAVPLTSGADSVSFSAYAFNRDLVKSRTAYVDLPVPPEARPTRPRRAFIVSLGVDRFDDPRWDLAFAAADARAYHAALDSTLTASGEYDAVVAVALVSDHDRARSTDATAAALRGALLRLAGDPLDAEAEAALARVPGADRLAPVTPDDVVIVTASTHGYASPEGVFYLLPADIPTVTDGPALSDAAFLDAAVSSDELSLWLRGVDAGTLAVVVDACNAAGAVEGNDFKPGPMGARGLGQLAFDKGAAVLTATQANAPALESSSTERGLLTFALVENGLLSGQADGASGEAPDGRITLEEWLAYGVARVPGLYAEVASDSVSTYGRDLRVRSVTPELAGPELAEGEEGSGAQTPALFDFRKGARPTTLATRPRAEE